MERRAIEALIQRWTREGICDGKLETFDELLAEDVRDRSGPVESTGVESFKARTIAVRSAFAEIDLRVDDLIVDGDAFAWRWSLTGVHVGPFAGIGPTGKRVTVRGVNFQRVRDGRIVDHWTTVDVFGAIQLLRS